MAHIGAKDRAANATLAPAEYEPGTGAVEFAAGSVVTGIRGRVTKDAVRPDLGMA